MLVGNKAPAVLLCAPTRSALRVMTAHVPRTHLSEEATDMIPREEVLEIVKGHLVDTIEELEGVEIDPAQSMKDLGANSLDIVEVVSCSMRDLKVKVPRSELNTLENIDQLVDLLHRVAAEKAQA